VVLASGLLTEEQFDQAIAPEAVTSLGSRREPHGRAKDEPTV
jgi:hypothetical protein